LEVATAMNAEECVKSLMSHGSAYTVVRAMQERTILGVSEPVVKLVL